MLVLKKKIQLKISIPQKKEESETKKEKYKRRNQKSGSHKFHLPEKLSRIEMTIPVFQESLITQNFGNPDNYYTIWMMCGPDINSLPDNSKYPGLVEQFIDCLLLYWENGGQEKFRNIAKQYYKGANGVLLIYDICNRKSFERVEFWMNELKENNQIESLYTILVANKIDLENKRVVTREEGEKYAEDNNISYFEVSAKTGEGIVDFFNITCAYFSKHFCFKFFIDA